MADAQARYSGFEDAYQGAMKRLGESYPDDDALSALSYIEEARLNSGSDDHVPDWIQPFVSIAARLVAAHPGQQIDQDDESMRTLANAIRPVVARAIQLGYTEGYFTAKNE